MTREQADQRIIQDKDWRKRLDDILQEMKVATSSTDKSLNTGVSRHRSLSITHTEDAIMRLGMDMKEINENVPGSAPNPYPKSYDSTSTKVEPTSEGLRL